MAAAEPDASGSFSAKRGRIVGVLMRSPDKRGNLEVRADGAGPWVRLSQQGEPRFNEEDDPRNYLQRYLFAAYGLPLYCDSIEFRVSADPEVKGNTDVQIVGFLVIERPAAMPFTR